VRLWGAVARGADAVPDADAVRRRYSDFYTAIPKSGYLPKSDPKQVDLGRRLFFERALSADRARSCNDCHDLSKYGTNGAAAIRARDAGALRRDVPSVYNISTLTLMRWVGVRSDLRTQIGASLLSPAESGMESEAAVVDRLENLPTYTARFEKAFGDEGDAITFDRVVDALLAFQKGLVTRAPFDEFLLGEDDALTAQQLRGAILFDVKNCSACHTGQAIGGQMLQKAGIVIPWPNQKDTGYFEETGVEVHRETLEWYTTRADDFESARGEVKATWGLQRGDWRAWTVTHTIMTCDRKSFYLHARLDAYEGRKRVCARNWDMEIPRKLV